MLEKNYFTISGTFWEMLVLTQKPPPFIGTLCGFWISLQVSHPKPRSVAMREHLMLQYFQNKTTLLGLKLNRPGSFPAVTAMMGFGKIGILTKISRNCPKSFPSCNV